MVTEVVQPPGLIAPSAPASGTNAPVSTHASSHNIQEDSPVKPVAAVEGKSNQKRPSPRLQQQRKREPMSVTWRNLSLTSPADAQRQILKNVSGFVTSGDLLAVMGPSGCGKSTLLEVLSQQRAFTSGEMRVNGAVLQSGDWLKMKNLSIVRQDDILTGSMTVRENLNFYADMLLSKWSARERRHRVEDLLEELGLVECADVYVGHMLAKSISGGQKRRLSLAVGLLADPDVLLLDEPTSGLDAATSLQVAEILRRLADSGRIIICTIHQPRTSVYALFNKVLLLSAGETVYFGDRPAAVDYFADECSEVCGEDENVADFVVDLLTQYSVEADQRGDRLRELKDTFANSRHTAALLQDIDAHARSDITTAQLTQTLKATGALESANWLWQFWKLFARYSLNSVRNPLVSMSRIVQVLITAVFYGIVYLNIGDAQSAIQSRLGFLLFLTINIAFMAAAATAIAFIGEKALLVRERANNVYSLSAYFWATAFGDLPTQLLLPLLQIVFLYWMVPLNSTAEHFWLCYCVLLILFLASSAIGLVVSAVAPNLQVAAVLTPIVIVMNLLLSGMPVLKDQMPSFIAWATNISILRWAFIGAAVNEVSDRTFSCTVAERQQGQCQYETGSQILADFSASSATVGQALGVLVALLVFYQAAAFFILWLQDRSRRRS